MRAIQIVLSGLFIFILIGCTTAAPTATPFQLYQGPTAVLPTPAPPTPIPPTNTPVMARQWTPTPIPTATPLPSDVLALVANVPTADTLEVVMQGDLLNQVYTVRLLGIAVPPKEGASAWGIVAFKTVRNMLNGKVVRLVQDSTIQNSDGELPRYVYLQGTLINLELVKAGLAKPAFAVPDTKFQARFTTAANAANEAKLGVWGAEPTPTANATPSTTVTATATATLTVTATITATAVVSPTATGTP